MIARRLLALALLLVMSALVGACSTVYENEEDAEQERRGNRAHIRRGEVYAVTPLHMYDALDPGR